MTPESQVLLAVLGPIGAAILAIGGKLLDRHLKLIDKIEARMVDDAKERAGDREIQLKLIARLERVEVAIGLEDKIDELHAELRRDSTGQHLVISPEQAEREIKKRGPK